MFPVTRRRFTARVIFFGSDHRRFWRIFTKRGWRHCLVIIPAYYPQPGLNADRYSVVINPVTNHIAVDVDFQSPDDLCRKALDEGATCVIEFPVDTVGFRNYIPRGFLTCVSLLKALMGIRAWMIITPRQLARWLLRNGGKMIEGRKNVDTVRTKTEAK